MAVDRLTDLAAGDKSETLLRDLTKTQLKLNDIRNSATQLSAQQNETETVQKELKELEEDAVVYRMVGPVLVKQSVIECRDTVERRLEFINNELKKADALAADLLKKADQIAADLQHTTEKSDRKVST